MADGRGRVVRRAAASVLLLAPLALAALPAAAAGTATVVPSIGTVSEVADWSLVDPQGPWDFEDPTAGWALSPSESPPSSYDAWAQPSGGAVTLTGRRTLHLRYAQSGAVPSERNGNVVVDGTRWTRLSAYVYVDRAAYLFVQSRQCDFADTSNPRPPCSTANASAARPLSPGWNLVVDHPLSGAGWDAAIEGVQLRLCPAQGASCSTDPDAPLLTQVAWARLQEGDAPTVGFDVVGGTAQRLGWSRSPATGRASDVGEIAVSGTSFSFPASVLEPGAYRFRVDDGGGWGPWSASPVVVQPRPRPVVIDPDALGAPKAWASEVRGDPWDMATAGDVQQVDGAVSWTTTGGWLRGTSSWSDPRVTLDLDGLEINTRRWHRLSVEVDTYAPWHLTGTSGVLGRLLWWPTAAPIGAVPTTGDDVILPGGTGWVHVDLATDPPARAEEQGGPGAGWTDLGSVRALRWDPHEVDAARAFGLGEVRLGRNDQVDASGAFTFRWRDDAFRPGTTWELRLVDGRQSDVGTVIGSGTMTAADATYAWVNPGTIRGTRWVRLALTDVDGATTVTWSTGPVDVTERATFVDVPFTSGFYDDVDWLVGAQLATGDPDRYHPNGTMSRQAMAAFLYRLAGAPAGADPGCATAPFPDVPAGHAFCGEIAWLVGTGVTTGYADGGFHPAEGVSRQAMAAFLLRFAGWRGHAVPSVGGCAGAPFPDVAASHPFCGAIAWLVDRGIATGYADGRFHPGAGISRVAMAAFVHRLDGAGLS